MQDDKKLWDYKIGETIENEMFDFMKPPVKAVKKTIVFQDNEGAKFKIGSKHEDFKEEE